MAQRRGYQYQPPPEEEPPDDESAATEVSPSEPPAVPQWPVDDVKPLYEEEKRMMTPQSSVEPNGTPQPAFNAAQLPAPESRPVEEKPYDFMAPARTPREQELRELRQAGETVQALISQAHSVVTTTAQAKVQLNQCTLFVQGDGQTPANPQWLSWFFASPAQDQMTLIALHGSRLNLALAYKVVETMGVVLSRLDGTADITGGAQLRERILAQIARNPDGQPSSPPKSVGSLDQAYQLEAKDQAKD